LPPVQFFVRCLIGKESKRHDGPENRKTQPQKKALTRFQLDGVIWSVSRCSQYRSWCSAQKFDEYFKVNASASHNLGSAIRLQSLKVSSPGVTRNTGSRPSHENVWFKNFNASSISKSLWAAGLYRILNRCSDNGRWKLLSRYQPLSHNI
jgi:hypothetical protein